MAMLQSGLILAVFASACLLAPRVSPAGPTNTLDSLKATYEKQSRSITDAYEKGRADALQQYGKAVEDLVAALKQKGDLEGYLAAAEEKKRFDAGQTVAENDDGIAQGDVLMARKRCRSSLAAADQRRTAGSVALLKQYVAQLENLIRQLVVQDKIESAKEVRDKLDEAQFMLADAESRLPIPPVAKAPEPAAQPKAPPPAPKTSKPAPSSRAARRASQAGKPRTIDVGHGVTMEFVLIPADSFVMGSDSVGDIPAHRVTLSSPFYIGKYEVTQEQWEELMGGNPGSFKGARNPVESVSWNDCQIFLSKLSAKAPGMEARLPREAEWEYACRAGSETEFCFGDGELGLSEYAWFSCRGTHPVGEKQPNAWGLYDMHGNVWEWCSDWSGTYSGAAETDPQGPAFGSARVRRGGSWGNEAGDCRSSSSIGLGPDDRVNDVGLRVVLVVR